MSRNKLKLHFYETQRSELPAKSIADNLRAAMQANYMRTTQAFRQRAQTIDAERKDRRKSALPIKRGSHAASMSNVHGVANRRKLKALEKETRKENKLVHEVSA